MAAKKLQVKLLLEKIVDAFTIKQITNTSTTLMWQMGQLRIMYFHVGVGQYNHVYTYDLSAYFPHAIMIVMANNTQTGFAAADAVSVSWSGTTVYLNQYNAAGANMDMSLCIIGY